MTAIARTTDDIFTLISSPTMKAALTRAIPTHIKPDRMLRVVLTALRATPALGRCQQGTVIGSILQLAALGLEPNTPLGLAYLVPYGNICTPIIGYKGMIELAYRSGRIRMLDANVARVGDAFSHHYSFEPDFSYERKAPLTAALTHAWCWGVTTDGGRFLQVLNAEDIAARRARSAAGGSRGPWKTDEAAMWRKTAIRAAQWRLPQSPEMQRVEALARVDAGELALADALDPNVLDVLEDHHLELPSNPAEPPAEGAGERDEFFGEAARTSEAR